MEFGLDKYTNERVRPIKGLSAICQYCGVELTAKCGNINVHHWAHKSANCDSWWEHETEWHRNWKSNFPSDWREVVKFDSYMEKHVADIYNPFKELVIEFQNSPISNDEIVARENFYKQMIWVVNAQNISLELIPIHSIDLEAKLILETFLDWNINEGIKIPFEIVKFLSEKRDALMLKMKAGSYRNELHDFEKIFNEQFEIVFKKYTESRSPKFIGVAPLDVKRELFVPLIRKAINDIEILIRENNKLDTNSQYYIYNWKKRRKAWDYANKPIFLDIGDELLWIQTQYILKKVPKEKFILKYSGYK